MVQVLEDPSFSSQLGMTLGRGLGNFGAQALQGHMQQKRSKQFADALKERTGVDVSGYPPELQEKIGQMAMASQFEESLMGKKSQMEREKMQSIVSSLIDRGMDPEEAMLYAQLTTGGQTAFAKDILEAKKRGMDQFGRRVMKPIRKMDQALSEGDQQAPEAQVQMTPQQEVENDLATYEEEKDAGLTPAERIKRGSERYKTNLPIYQEAGTKLRAMTRDKERIGILENLDKSGKLPKNLGRLNVDDEGNLRFPFASSPEAQRYVKTLNEFSAGAKDTFGSRVTNFDLQQYLLRYPNLLNSSDGRKQIYQQMKIVNDINSIHYKNLKNVYDKAGGIRSIDSDAAESMAEKLSEPKVNELTKKFNEVGTFPTLPSASEFKGRKIRDKDTGEILQSDGQNWNPVQ